MWDRIKRWFSGQPQAVFTETAVQVEPPLETEQVSAFINVDGPRASFTITDITDGQIRVEFDWNETFLKQIRAMGFTGETDEDTVQLFFYASSMRPMGFDEDIDLSSPEVRLTHENNLLRE